LSPHTTITLVSARPSTPVLEQTRSDITINHSNHNHGNHVVTTVTPSVRDIDLQLAGINTDQSVHWAASPVLNMIIVILDYFRVVVVHVVVVVGVMTW